MIGLLSSIKGFVARKLRESSEYNLECCVRRIEAHYFYGPGAGNIFFSGERIFDDIASSSERQYLAMREVAIARGVDVAPYEDRVKNLRSL